MKIIDGFFSYSETNHSYSKPLFKLLLFPIITVALFFRPRFNIRILDGIITVAAIVIEIFAILYCLYIPMAELFSVASYKRKKREKKVPYKLLSTDQIASLCLENDIIDFEVSVNGTLVHIGSSSEIRRDETTFSNKRYYFGSIEYVDFSEFFKSIIAISVDGYIKVCTIDDVRQNTENTV